MSDTRPRMIDLTPRELEALALEHVASMFIEVRRGFEVAREQLHPVRLVRRHPVAATGLAAAAAFMMFRRFRSRPAQPSGEGGRGPGMLDSLLSDFAGAAGRALPGLVTSWLASRSRSD
jgi:hypothetical protein